MLCYLAILSLTPHYSRLTFSNKVAKYMAINNGSKEVLTKTIKYLVETSEFTRKSMITIHDHFIYTAYIHS